MIEAHTMEQSLDWLGIACAPGTPRLDPLWDWNLIVVYPIPKKGAETKLLPAVTWNVPSASELVRKASENGMMADGDSYKWDVLSKIERTIQFGIYLKLGKSYDRDPGRYIFLFPMHMVEQSLGLPE